MKNIKNYQPKVEMQEKKIHQKIEREREREREKERTFFCEGKLCIEWKRWWQIYNKRVWIRRDKNKGRWRERGRMILM